MRISLESLDGRHFVMELPVEGTTDQQNVISIQHAGNLRGVYRQDDTVIALEGAKVDELVAEALWHLAAGPLKVAGPITGGGIAIDLVIPRGEGSASPAGRAAAASLTVPSLSLVVGDAQAPTQIAGRVAVRELAAANPAEPNVWHLLLAELECAHVAVSRTGLDVVVESLVGEQVAADIATGSTSGRANAIVIGGLGVQTPGFGIRVNQTRLKDLRVVNDSTGPTLEVAEVELAGVTVRIGPGEGAQHVKTSGSIRISGLRYAGGSATCARIEVDDATVVAQLGSAQTEAVAPESKRKDDAAPASGTGLPDLQFLDQLHGFINADVAVDVKLPIISHRVAKLKLRLDVQQGTIDFKKLENGLSTLEDALLDFEVKKQALVIEVKGVRKTLVAWPLDAEGLALAQRNRVKLRTLAAPDLPKESSEPKSTPTPSDREPSVGLKRLDVGGIEVQLGLGGGEHLVLPQATIRLGSSERPALDQLTLQGAIAYAPPPFQARASRAEHTTLRASLRGLNVGVDRLALGAASVTVGNVQLKELADVTLTMAGLAPERLELTARGLVLESIAYRNSAR